MLRLPRLTAAILALGSLAGCSSCDTTKIEFRELNVGVSSPYVPSVATVTGAVELPSNSGDSVALTISFGDESHQSVTVAKDGSFSTTHEYVKAGGWVITATATSGGARGQASAEIRLANPVNNLVISCQVCTDGVCAARACQPNDDGVVESGPMLAVRGTAEGGVGALRYIWNWGDNTVDTEGQAATHVYRTPGDYNVRLTVEDQKASVQATAFTARVGGFPTVQALMEAPMSSGRAPFMQTITLRATGEKPMTLFVDWKDGTSITVPEYQGGGEAFEIDKVFTTGGTFESVLTAVDRYGTRATATKTFTVQPPLDTSSSAAPATSSATSMMSATSAVDNSSSLAAASASGAAQSSSAAAASASAETAASSAAAASSTEAMSSSRAAVESSSAAAMSSSAAAVMSSSAEMSSSQ